MVYRLYLQTIHEQPHTMSDSPDLRSVITENMNDDEHVTNQETETPKAQVETPETPQEQPVQETKEEFSQRIESKGRTPEELDEIYSKYQKAYTQKRQKEKEEIKKYQDQIKAYEDRLKTPPQAPSPVPQEQKEVQRQFDLGNLSFEQYTQAMQRFAIDNARRIAQEEFEKLSVQREDGSNQQQMLQRFNSLDERFDQKFTNPESPEYNHLNSWLYRSVAMELGNALQAHIDANGSSVGFDSDTIAKEAIKHFDEQIDAVVTSRVKESTQNAQSKATVVARSNPKGGTTPSKTTGTRDLRELISSKMSD